MTQRLVLASGSPRRRELLVALTAAFDVVVSNVDEPPVEGDPVAGAIALARAKAEAVASQMPDSVVLAADTVVHDGLRAYGKPESAEDALAVLRALRGRLHRVVTGIAVAGPRGVATDASTAVVELAGMDDQTITAYVASGRPMDKAGAYAIQDEDVPTVAGLDGCYCAVVGLPLWKAGRLLGRAGIPVGDPAAAYPRCTGCPDRDS